MKTIGAIFKNNQRKFYGCKTLSITCTTPLRHITSVAIMLEAAVPPLPFMVAPFVDKATVVEPANIGKAPFAKLLEKARVAVPGFTTCNLNTDNKLAIGI